MIRVHDLRYRYPGAETRALDGLDFEVDSDEILGLVGPSGAGKSTTRKVPSVLLDGYEGEVAAFGREVREWESDYYEHVGVSSESSNHYLKLTSAENLELLASLYGETREPGAARSRGAGRCGRSAGERLLEGDANAARLRTARCSTIPSYSSSTSRPAASTRRPPGRSRTPSGSFATATEPWS